MPNHGPAAAPILTTGADYLPLVRSRTETVYSDDAEFGRISFGNFGSYVPLGRDATFTYAVHLHRSFGFALVNQDVDLQPRIGMVPVLDIMLSDVSVDGYRRARRLHVRRSFEHRGVPIQFYVRYVEQYGGVVLDGRCLEPGAGRWARLLAAAADHGFRVTAVDSTGRRSPPTPDELDVLAAFSTASGADGLVILERAC